MIVVVVNVLRYTHFIISLINRNAGVSLMICVDAHRIGLMSHWGICSCLAHKAVRHQHQSLLIGRHPGRGSAAPQPISRAERHTRIARRFGAQRHTAFQQRTLSTSRFLLVRGLQPCALHSEGDWRKFFCQDVVTKPYQRSFDDLYEGA